MNATESLQFSRVLSRGMVKYAGIGQGPIHDIESSVIRHAKDITPRIKLKHLLMAGGVGAGVGAAGEALQKHTKQAALPFAPEIGQAIGKTLGSGARLGNIAATNAGDAVGFLGGRAAMAGKDLASFMTKQRQMPSSGFLRGLKGGFADGNVPPGPNSGFGGGFRRGWQTGRGPLEGYGAQPINPRTFKTPPANPTPGYVGSGAFNPRTYKAPPATSPPGYMNFRSGPTPTVSAAPFNPEVPPAAPAFNVGGDAAPTSSALTTTNRSWTGGPTGQGAAASPATGGNAPLWQQNLSAMKSKWNALPTWGKGVAAYGGVTAATAPATASNNAQADWQQQNPIMSYLGKTFGGMQERTPHSYLMPSFMQH